MEVVWCSWLSRLLYTQKIPGSNPGMTKIYFYYAFDIIKILSSVCTIKPCYYCLKLKGNERRIGNYYHDSEIVRRKF